MAATSILSTDDEMNAMAGENVNTTGWTDANKTAWGLQAEAYVASLSKYDWSTNVTTILGVAAEMLSEFVARYTATGGLAYNMANLTTRFEAESMIAIHLARMNAIEELLKDPDFVNFVSNSEA